MSPEVRSQKSEVRSGSFHLPRLNLITKAELSALHQRKRAAFSLVELLVTMGVLSTLMILLMSFFTQATDAWNKSENRIDSYREVRAAFYYIKRDLGTMIVSDQLPWLHLADPAGSADPLMEDTIRGEPSNPAQGNAIFFLSAKTADAQGDQGSSDLCAVGYYLAWGPDWASNQPSGSAPPSSYKLYRYFKASDALWNSSLRAFLQGWDPASKTSSSHLFPTALALVGTSGDEVIARNVVNFEITPYRWNATTAVYEAPPAGTNWDSWQTDGKFLKPDMIEVSLLAFNSETALRLGGNKDRWHVDSSQPENSGVLQGQNAQVFHMRIPLR
jgi:type II secretory pathway pseudopilin PulG